MADKPPESSVLWGRYLAYATAFGLGDEISHVLAQPRLGLGDRLGVEPALWSGRMASSEESPVAAFRALAEA